MNEEIDTFNRFMVGVQGNKIVILAWQRWLSKAEALNLAASLVSLADPGGEEFAKIFEAIKNV